MNLEDLRVKKTKSHLQLALMDLLREKPLEKITVTELCQRSEITRKTFYLHYKNVAAYFAELVDDLLNELENALLKSTKERLQRKNQLQPQMVHLFEHVFHHKDFYQFIFNSHSRFSYYELFLNRIKKLVKSSVESSDSFHPLTNFEVSYQANAIMGVILEWYYEGFEQPIAEMNRILLQALRWDGTIFTEENARE